MNERDRPRRPTELPRLAGLGNPLSLGGDNGSSVIVESGVYTEQQLVAGRTVGEIRRMAESRYGAPPQARAILDGHDVDDDTVVRAGQRLQFVRYGGEKGQSALDDLLRLETSALLHEALGRRRRPAPRKAPRVTFEGEVASTTSPEGHKATMGVGELLDRFGGLSGTDLGALILADGVKAVVPRDGFVVVVHQTPPAVHRLKWIKRGSKTKHGPGTEYRHVRIALPYLLVFALFESDAQRRPRLSGRNECFFRTEPLRSPDDRLMYPALLNCSKFDNRTKPLSWICTQHLKPTILPESASSNDRIRQGLHDLMHCMLETGFNYSSEEYEVSSWYSESKDVDPRISTIERWEAATLENPMFVHGVPWVPVGMSVREVTDRMLNGYAGRLRRPRTSHDVARVICNHGTVEQPDGEAAQAKETGS